MQPSFIYQHVKPFVFSTTAYTQNTKINSSQIIVKMRFFASASALLAMATAAVAQTDGFNPVYTPATGDKVIAGSPFTVTWGAPAKYADATISISLIGGATQGTLQPIADIASKFTP